MSESNHADARLVFEQAHEAIEMLNLIGPLFRDHYGPNLSELQPTQIGEMLDKLAFIRCHLSHLRARAAVKVLADANTQDSIRADIVSKVT